MIKNEPLRFLLVPVPGGDENSGLLNWGIGCNFHFMSVNNVCSEQTVHFMWPHMFMREAVHLSVLEFS